MLLIVTDSVYLTRRNKADTPLIWHKKYRYIEIRRIYSLVFLYIPLYLLFPVCLCIGDYWKCQGGFKYRHEVRVSQGKNNKMNQEIKID